MMVTALIRALTPTNRDGKPGAILVIETESPLAVHELRLNKMHIANGVVSALTPYVGQVVQIPLAENDFNGKKSLQWPMDYPFYPPVAKKAVQAAS